MTHLSPDVIARIDRLELEARQVVEGYLAGRHRSPRHGFAVECIANAIPLTTLQKWMGHARLETTAIYLQVMGAEERRLARRLWTGL